MELVGAELYLVGGYFVCSSPGLRVASFPEHMYQNTIVI